jgi:hypothetical protein
VGVISPYRTAPVVEAPRVALADRLRCLVGRIDLDRLGEVWRGGGDAIDFDVPAREWLRGRANFDLLVRPASVWGRAWAVTIETPDDIRNA